MSTSGETTFQKNQPDAFAGELQPFAAELVSIEPLRSAGFQAKARAWSLDDFRIFKVDIAQARVSAPPNMDTVSLSMPLDRAFVRTNGDPAVIEPGECYVRVGERDMDVSLDQSSVLVVNLDAALLHDTAISLAGGESPSCLSAEPVLSLSSAGGGRFWRELTRLWRDLRVDESSLTCAPVVSQRRSDLCAALVDLMQPVNDPELPGCGLRAAVRAEDFIMANLGEPISRADICKAVGVSERQLTRVFHQRYGMGPIAFFRQRRFEAAQRLLLAGDPSEQKVTTIATHCGFHHLGRFAVNYGRMFGESPVQSLNR